MREGELTYDDFLRRLNIQDVLIDAGYHLNRRDGLRYPSYVRLTARGGASATISSLSRSKGNAVSNRNSRNRITSFPLSRSIRIFRGIPCRRISRPTGKPCL